VANLEGDEPAPPPPLGDGLTSSLLIRDNGNVPSPVYICKHVKYGTQDMQNDCHQWLSDSLQRSPTTP